jgi:hypothetical protein
MTDITPEQLADHLAITLDGGWDDGLERYLTATATGPVLTITLDTEDDGETTYTATLAKKADDNTAATAPRVHAEHLAVAWPDGGIEEGDYDHDNYARRVANQYANEGARLVRLVTTVHEIEPDAATTPTP